jgi:hypothetical protein
MDPALMKKIGIFLGDEVEATKSRTVTHIACTQFQNTT